MGAARHIQRRAHGADSLGDVAIRILVRLPGADVVGNRYIDIRRDAEIGESADVHDPSAGHADVAADVPAVVGRVVAEIRIDGAGIVHVAHILAVGGRGGSIHGGGPRLAGAVTAVRRGIGVLDGLRVKPEIIMRGGIIVEGLQDGVHHHAGDIAASDLQARAAVPDPRVGGAAAVLEKGAGGESAHGDGADSRALVDIERAAVADVDVAAAGVASERDIRTLRRGREESAHVGGAVAIAVRRVVPGRPWIGDPFELKAAAGRDVQVLQDAARAGGIVRGVFPVSLAAAAGGDPLAGHGVRQAGDVHPSTVAEGDIGGGAARFDGQGGLGTPPLRYENAVALIEERADVASGPLPVEPDGQEVHTRAAAHIHAVEHAADHEAVNEHAGTGLAAHRSPAVVFFGDGQFPQIPPDLAAG